MPCNLTSRLRMIVDAPEIIAVRHRRERAVQWKNFETMTRQIQLANNFGAEERYNVRADGKLEPGKYFFSHCSAAQHMPPLKHQHAFTRAREISRVHKAIVATTDHDNVVFHLSSASSQAVS